MGRPVGVSYMDPRTSAARLHKVMSKTWPELEKVKVSHSWQGNVAFTFDFIPHLGVERGLHYALGCQGSGVGMQTYLGYRAGHSKLPASMGIHRPSTASHFPRFLSTGETHGSCRACSPGIACVILSTDWVSEILRFAPTVTSTDFKQDTR